VIATVAKDGTPRAAPVWFVYEGGALFIWTDAGRAWVRNIARQAAVTVAVAEHEAPFAAAVLRGSATVHDNVPWGKETIRAITKKYIASGEVDDYMRQWEHLKTIVRVEVGKVTGWGTGY
jgi:PPOX class probable F420-dependent enzyme